eukprot:11224534-Lingulodinium_polyedra.AAC.1
MHGAKANARLALRKFNHRDFTKNIGPMSGNNTAGTACRKPVGQFIPWVAVWSSTQLLRAI